MSAVIQLVSTIGLVLAIAYSIYRWKRRNLYAFAAKFTGPKEYPFIGSALMFLRNSPEEYFNVLNNVCQPTKTGEFSKIWFGPQLGLVISEPEDVQFFLHVTECLEKPYIYKFFGCDKGLFTAAADIWKDYRKVLNSTFNVKILRNFISIFNDKDIVLADKLKVHLGAGQFDVYKSVGKCALDNICATTMGLNLNLQNDSFDGNKFMGALERWLEKVTERMFNCFYHIDFIYKLTRQYKIHSEAIKDCYHMTSKVIETKRRELETEDKTDESYLADDYKRPQIYINQLFKLSKETNMFDDAAIADHIFTIIFGGHETSALTASTALVLLAIHQDVQDKVAVELREVFYTDDEYPDMEILGKLTYMDMVVKEVLRLFPGAPYIARFTTAEVQMPTRNLTIPKNVIVGIPIYNIHRDPKHWGPNADEFNPDNFLPENDKKRNTYTYIPFAAGPRVCLGAKYATLSIKVMLTILLRKYKFHTTLTMDTIVKKFDITMKLGHEHLVSVEPRNF